ncbi:DNA mismatch repair endonuclease MutL [Alphaproteobacteria bacterium endosymbiont of Tiliacea citrago]|uniref:DNA mismatch repair endonuclease MutL n=1 Tax=Alphaproteobacteria bacterium endosymbiont of Tiliacea citrago TaxID=3077944 RepID=UPI00313CA7E9
MIKKLSELIIKQIAAGEVIQKPYNVVKELVENSIDSNATEISLFFKDYGMGSIIIIDNGYGFSKEDLEIATLMHTTSKTNDNDSLFGLNSYGFRGEALSSIDSISDLIIESNGFMLKNKSISISLVKQGTKISVNNLFQNIPARLKFIKNPSLEFKFIKELLKKFIISTPQISWNVHLNGKKIWKLLNDSQENRVEFLFKEKPIMIEKEFNGIKIKAFILKNSSNVSVIFVNNRIIKDKAINKYLYSLFKEYTFINENPGYILEVTIDPLMVDYNVHPAKEEIRFVSYSDVFRLLSSVFSMHNLVNDLNINFSDYSLNNYKSISDDLYIKEESIKGVNDCLVSEKLFDHYSVEKQDVQKKFACEAVAVEDVFQEAFQSKNKEFFKEPVCLFKVIGQFRNSYILFETQDGLGVFDQHAAHERKIYEELKLSLNKESSQKLLMPIKLSFSIERKDFILNNCSIFEEKGVFLNEKELLGVPIILKNITDLVEFLNNIDVFCNIETEIDRFLANIACKNALKANTSLSYFQMHNLLQSALLNPPVCNHGRPVFKWFSDNQVMAFFKRI